MSTKALPKHFAVWIDHHEAKIFHVETESFDSKSVHAPDRHIRKHPTATREHNHPADDKHYYHAVAQELASAGEILIVGPSTAKLELIRHLQSHDPKTAAKIVGVETVDHPTEGQLVAYVRSYFHLGTPPRNT
jgi:stalled ribosome rescue protein Dom34